MGFPSNLFLFFRITNSEDYYTEIETLATFPSIFTKANVTNPLILLRELNKTPKSVNNQINQFGSPQINFNFKTINFFKGIAELDSSFTNHLKTQIVKLIMKSLKVVEKSVEEKIEQHKKIIESKSSISFGTSTGHNSIIIDRM
jgi:hypothetical protein